MGTKRYDLVFEFDNQGALVRHDEIEKLATRSIAENAPIDTTLPMELQVLYRESAKDVWSPAVLNLGENVVSLVTWDGSAEPRAVQPEAIVELDHVSDDEELWRFGWLSYQLRYSDEEDALVVLRLRVPVLDLLRLAKYIQARDSVASITD
jgi:hypothetical protein